MSDELDAQWLEIMAGVDRDFNVAIDRAELALASERGDGITSVEIVERAWDSLSAEQRIAQMPRMFNAVFSERLRVREWLQLSDAVADATTYLEHGDLEIGEDCLSGMLVMEGGPPGSIEGLMVELPLTQVFRLTDEIKLLQHHLKMKEASHGEGAA